MRVLFDTNVVLDFLMDRQPFSVAATKLFARVEAGKINGFLGATTVTTVHYLASRQLGEAKARERIGELLTLFEVAPVNGLVLKTALDSDFADFEDSVLHESGLHSTVQCIVTRDPKGFARAKLAVFSPDALLTVLEAEG